MENFNTTLKDMIEVLDNIIAWDTPPNIASQDMSEIVSKIKLINTRMKVFLEQEKVLTQKKIKEKQEALSKIWKQISKTLDELILSVSTKLLKKKSLSSKEKKLVESLVILRQENNKIKNFNTLEFESIRQMQNYLKTVITEIRSEFKKIRSI